jgi:hypothetical protein
MFMIAHKRIVNLKYAKKPFVFQKSEIPNIWQYFTKALGNSHSPELLMRIQMAQPLQGRIL